MASIYWVNQPTILFDKEYILEIWPTSTMSYVQKLNAISRLIILLSILGFGFTPSGVTIYPR